MEWQARCFVLWIRLTVVPVLKAEGASEGDERCVYQVCMSGSTSREPFGGVSTKGGVTNKDRVEVIRGIAQGFAEPFRSFLSLVCDDTDVKELHVDDFAPRKDMFASGGCGCVGDAAHAMTKCGCVGEAAHTITKCGCVGDTAHTITKCGCVGDAAHTLTKCTLVGDAAHAKTMCASSHTSRNHY
jgi:hypothetical protein